jgi:uncharacterized membrane protein (UPF0127 family)
VTPFKRTLDEWVCCVSFDYTQESVRQGSPERGRRVHHERNQLLAVHPERSRRTRDRLVEGLGQGFHWLHRLAQLALLLALSSLAVAADSRVQLLAGAHAIQVEIADTPQKREIGLMGRTRLEANTGMLFVFEQKATHCFWMKNTLIPLSIAFLADDGTIVDIQDMQPQTLTFHCPRGPIRYALEVPLGGFRSKGIQLGMRVSGGPFGTPP